MAGEGAVRPDLGKLPPEIVALLRRLGALGHERGMAVHLVGGLVRDLCLEVGTPELDVCVEGDGRAFARRVAEVLGGTAVVHDRFLTATVRLADLTMLDVATSRTETYERAGALPRVTPAPLEADLRRRDFTMNAMAVRLSPGEFGALIDPFGGAADIGSRALRVLHGKSFVDDPTRIVRMARFAARLGFEPEPGTAGHLAEAIGSRVFDFVSADRLREEVFLALAEGEPAAVFERLGAWGVLDALLPGVLPAADSAEMLELAGRVAALVEKAQAWDPSVLRLLVLVHAAPPEVLEAVGKRLNLSPAARGVLRLAPRLPELVRAAEGATKASGVHRVLGGLPLEVQLAVLILTGPEKARERVFNYIRDGRRTVPELDGDDLADMGHPRGPKLKAILEALVSARLDGTVKSRRDEERWVREHFPPFTN